MCIFTTSTNHYCFQRCSTECEAQFFDWNWRNKLKVKIYSEFHPLLTRRNLQPSITILVFPPVEIQSILEQPEQIIVDCEWLNTPSLIVEQFEHLTSMKYEFGCWIKRFNLWQRFSSSGRGYSKSFAIGIFLWFAFILLNDKHTSFS